MKPNLRRYCVLLALLIHWVPQMQGQVASPRVQQIEVRHVGPAAASDELIRANIRVKVGDPLMKTSVDDDVRNLYNTGYFYNIRVAEERTDGGVKLIYVVQGKPLLTDVQFTGNTKFKTSKLQPKLTSKIGQPLDERKLFTDAQEIQKSYQKAGYQRTKVEYKLNINENAGRGAVTFEVTEAPKVKVVDIQFVGATAFPEKRLAKVLKTKEHWMFSWLTGSDKFKDDQFEDDKEKLTDFYRNEGYLDFEIKEIQFDNPKPDALAIKFQVFEGKQYKVGTVAVKGNNLFPSAEVERDIKMTAGKTFTPEGQRKDVESVRDFYGTKGYIDSRVTAVRTPNTETGNIDVTYQVDEKDKSFVEKIEIKGNVKTKDKVLRRELAISPGETFDMVRVKLSKQRLENLNYFEKVDAQPEPTDVPNRKNLVVNVEEKNTGNMSVGAGLSSVESVVGFVEVTQGNFDLFKPPWFTGGGQKMRLRASYGSRRQDYLLSFTEPWFLDRKLAFSVDLYHRNTSFQSTLYDQTQTGMRLGLEQALWSDFVRGNVSYTIEDVGIKNVDPGASPELKAEAGSQLVSKIGAGLTYDTRTGGLTPTGGHRVELISELAGGPLGGDADFYRLELRGSQYLPGFWSGQTWEILGRVGAIESYNSRPITLFNRYFLGGPRTLRGYRFSDVAPRDSLNEPLGGNTYWLGSVEYSIPLVERLRFAMFYDIGNVYTSSFSFNPNKAKGETLYQDNVGVGFRINIPNLGPLRLDYGIPLTTDRNQNKSGRFNFDVGFTRDF
ncbi:MAG: outer membrane protein assembly factor BamA [Pedosphaera sp. Tous-C6FEB]|nr:MAG: outer membrane protein assembly factor BamA [Pedosphaera sp. Tous-C6FEB]